MAHNHCLWPGLHLCMLPCVKECVCLLISLGKCSCPGRISPHRCGCLAGLWDGGALWWFL